MGIVIIIALGIFILFCLGVCLETYFWTHPQWIRDQDKRIKESRKLRELEDRAKHSQ